MNDSLDIKWKKLMSLPDDSDCSRMFNIDADRFIITSFMHIMDLYEYDSLTDTFYRCIKDSKEKPTPGHRSVSFDKSKQILYIHKKKSIMSINLRTKIKTYAVNKEAERGTYFLFINNNFHIIKNYEKHWIGTVQNNKLQVLQNTIKTKKFTTIHAGAAIYIKSKHCILLIGGYYDTDGPLPNNICIYSLLNNEWKDISNIFTYECCGFAAVLTSNEKYIILMGGTEYGGYYDQAVEISDIFVVDIHDKDYNNWTMKKCKIKCPSVGTCFGISTGGIDSKRNELLVVGYIKNCFMKMEFEQLELPPVNIMMLIYKWFGTECIEMIHWVGEDIDEGTSDHYGIYLKDILSSL